MRRLNAAFAALLLTMAAGCSRHKEAEEADVEKPATLASMVEMNNASAAAQLTKGFYGVEANSWRWTAPQFSAVLKPPAGAAEKGGVLLFKFTIPDVVIQKVHNLTLSASVNGTALPPQTYTKSGGYTYSQDVPATALKGESVTADFSIDHPLPPTGGEVRSLGVIASQVGLESK